MLNNLKLKRVTTTLFAGLLFCSLVSASAKEQYQSKKIIKFLAPYYLLSESKNGKHVELIQASLESQGYRIYPILVPEKTLRFILKTQSIDAAYLPSNQSAPTKQPLYSSNAHQVNNRIAAISLQKNKLRIKSPESLTNYKVAALSHFKKNSHDELKRVLQANPRYFEMANAKKLIAKLLAGEVDLILMPNLVFEYYRTMIGQAQMLPVQQFFFEIPSDELLTYFTDQHVLQAYEKGIEKLKVSGKYQTIMSR